MSSSPEYVLVTGATGFIGAHVVDVLLSKGLRVRGATRSMAKAEIMLKTRPQHADKLDFVQVDDFASGGDFTKAVEGVDSIIHVASPFTYAIKDNEKELVIPAINGVKAILSAASSTAKPISRVVLTSSFASVINPARTAAATEYFTYTAADWNPITYEESIDPASPPTIAYRGSKVFAEKTAWDYVRDNKPTFDLVTLCPPMVFGPIAHPVDKLENLNESNAQLWKVAAGDDPLPAARVPFWVDVRDLAVAHVEALLKKEAGGKRFVVSSPEGFSFGQAAEIVHAEFPWAQGRVKREDQKVDKSHGLDGQTAAKELGYSYRSFKESVVDLVRQGHELEVASV